MARITKARARKPLADGRVSIGWRNRSDGGFTPGERFLLGIGEHAMELTRDEAQDLVLKLTERLADEELMKAAGLIP